MDNFLVYRELSQPFSPGEKKQVTKKNKRAARINKPGELYSRNSISSATSPVQPLEQSTETRGNDRALIGSLVDSYSFKEGGRMKKTISLQIHGVHYHLVSHYTIGDALARRQQAVTSDHRLVAIDPRHDLIARQNFRASLDETHEGYGDIATGQAGYYAPDCFIRSDMITSSNAHPTSVSFSLNFMTMHAPEYHTNMAGYALTQPVMQPFSSDRVLKGRPMG